MTEAELIRKLIGRPDDQFRMDADWRGKTVLVTGAGGSIGSVLCRRLVSGAKRVMALDHSEEGLARLARELADPVCVPELTDIRDARRVQEMFRTWRPDIVLHAAAYKHVTLLEHFPFQAMENNALATADLAKAAAQYGTERFVFVSTDKAADPASVMGASKHVAERAVLGMEDTDTKFAALRCGNVLGSSGSVLLIWREQIERGRVLTISDEAAERYFVTVDEATGALLEVAGRVDDEGLFGYVPPEPVRMGELARRMLNLLPNEGGTAFEVSGLLPGEKRCEELLGLGEKLVGGDAGPIRRIVCSAGAESLREEMAELRRCCCARDRQRLLAVLRKLVPGYEPSRLVSNGAHD